MRLCWIAMASVAALAACAPADGNPVPDMVEPSFAAEDALPVILRDRFETAMQAQVAGRLTRRGACLYIDDGNRGALILWGDDVRAARLDQHDWLVNDSTTNQRFREGDWLQGGGGFYPADRPVSDFAADKPPFECSRVQAVQFYDVRKVDPPTRTGPPSPPPPAPRRSTLLDHAVDWDGEAGPRRLVQDIDDPREAMFTYLLRGYRDAEHFKGVHVCLADADADLRERLSRRFGILHPQSACGWEGGGVVLEANGERAMFVDAQIDCSSARGFCAGAGGATYGNLGAEHGAYRLRRKGNGWEVEKLGLSIVA